MWGRALHREQDERASQSWTSVTVGQALAWVGLVLAVAVVVENVEHIRTLVDERKRTDAAAAQWLSPLESESGNVGKMTPQEILTQLAQSEMAASEVWAMRDAQFEVRLHAQGLSGRIQTEAEFKRVVRDPLGAEIIVASSLNSVFCPVSSAASTGWKLLLRKYSRVVNFRDVETMHDRFHNGLNYLDGFQPRELLAMYQDSRILKFVFVRNPFTRLLSFYLTHIGRGDVTSDTYQNYMRFWKSKMYAIEVRNGDVTQKPTFPEFVRTLYENREKVENRHKAWLPQTRLCFTDLLGYTFVGKLESFYTDAAMILRSWDAPPYDLALFVDARQGGANLTWEMVQEYYESEGTRQMVETMYAEDLEKLQYSFSKVSMGFLDD